MLNKKQKVENSHFQISTYYQSYSNQSTDTHTRIDMEINEIYWQFRNKPIHYIQVIFNKVIKVIPWKE
jgi:hypothetical protein